MQLLKIENYFEEFLRRAEENRPISVEELNTLLSIKSTLEEFEKEQVKNEEWQNEPKTELCETLKRVDLVPIEIKDIPDKFESFTNDIIQRYQHINTVFKNITLKPVVEDTDISDMLSSIFGMFAPVKNLYVLGRNTKFFHVNMSSILEAKHDLSALFSIFDLIHVDQQDNLQMIKVEDSFDSLFAKHVKLEKQNYEYSSVCFTLNETVNYIETQIYMLFEADAESSTKLRRLFNEPKFKSLIQSLFEKLTKIMNLFKKMTLTKKAIDRKSSSIRKLFTSYIIPVLEFLNMTEEKAQFLFVPHTHSNLDSNKKYCLLVIHDFDYKVVIKTNEETSVLNNHKSLVSNRLNTIMNEFVKYFIHQNWVLLLNMIEKNYLIVFALSSYGLVLDMLFNHEKVFEVFPNLTDLQPNKNLTNFLQQDLAIMIEEGIRIKLMTEKQVDKLEIFYKRFKVTIGWLTGMEMFKNDDNFRFYVVIKKVKAFEQQKTLIIAFNAEDDNKDIGNEVDVTGNK